MLYQKNLPTWERLLRVCMGALVAAAGLDLPPAGPTQWGALAGGIVFALTGFVGFCPMCALAGRKRERGQR